MSSEKKGNTESSNDNNSFPTFKRKMKLPDLKSQYQSEKELIDEVEVNLEVFKDLFIQLSKTYDQLIKEKESFPKKYIEKDDFEDYMIRASQAQALSITVNKTSEGISTELENKIEFYRSQLEIYMAEDALRNLNFNKPTDKLRESWMNTKPQLIEIKSLMQRFETLTSATDKLFKNFDTDIVNFRRFLEKKEKARPF